MYNLDDAWIATRFAHAGVCSMVASPLATEMNPGAHFVERSTWTASAVDLLEHCPDLMLALVHWFMRQFDHVC
jgi:hypothetical protein